MMKNINLPSRELLDQMWDLIDRNSTEYLDNHFIDIAPKLIQFLIISLLTDKDFEIGIFYVQEKKGGAFISYDIYNTDKQLTLRVTTKWIFILQLSVYDWDDNEKIYRNHLTEDEIKYIPIGLQNLMKEVVNTYKVQTIKAGTLNMINSYYN